MASGFDEFLARLCNVDLPHDWQTDLARSRDCSNRLIRIPTGMGKTFGVLATWVWHRVHLQNESWPRRLVWCLPMRVLVEQVEEQVRSAMRRIDVLWDPARAHGGKVGVHLLMGGADAGQWHLYPESDAVLIGTQDMLLSRALNRGYASPRARWPMEFGLLNHDALWVMDEVQLMDVGLATSGQLQAFRDEDQTKDKLGRSCFTWWMSATLQRGWLAKSPDTTSLMGDIDRHTHSIGTDERKGPLWDDASKQLSQSQFVDTRELALDVCKRHRDRGCGKDGPTLVVVNTVKRAVDVWKALRREQGLKDAATDIRLVHSRFRPAERHAWRQGFLNRESCGPETNRIIVSTQVVEAGMDISASLLFTELAPWPSLVQRFGRCARWGGIAQVIVADFNHDSEGKAAPYTVDELDASRDACDALGDVAPVHLELFEEENEVLLHRLYPYEPTHLLLRHELDELFDTSPDLSGADIDISRFIRSGDERDVQVFWAEVDRDQLPPSSMKPKRDELCAVPFLEARNWLCKPKSENLKPEVRAWVWDWLEREWRIAERRDVYPGQVVLVEAGAGGYCCESGWDPDSLDPVAPVRAGDDGGYVSRACWTRNGDGWQPSERRVRELPPADHADAAEDDESLSISQIGKEGEIACEWETIASHGLHVGEEVRQIAVEVVPSMSGLLHLVGRWHDLGKAHPAFQGSIQADDRPKRDDIAKAPAIAWPCSTQNMYRIDAGDQRRGFRHELASALGLFAVLQRHGPEHEALLGPWGEWFEAMKGSHADGGLSGDSRTSEPTPVEQEVLDLGAEEFDLLAYLVCAHHGKVRMTWHASSADQKAEDRLLRIRGVREDDVLPPVPLADADGGFHQLPAMSLDLSPSEAGLSPRTGRSWTERVLNLVERFGPFTLAWLEALVRAADHRASSRSNSDRLLQDQEDDHVTHALDGSRRRLAPTAAGGATATSSGGDSPSRRKLHGDGGRTRGRRVDPGTTRPPHTATRYVETTAGILSYRQLAPLLAERVAETELAISDRRFTALPFRDLLLELHRSICGDLTPQIAGRWRLRDVRVGEHRAPPHWQVPVLMHNYAADLEVRFADPDAGSGERPIDDLAFAEGHLLHIHPFEDFNGRVTRLYLIELLYRLNLPVIDTAAQSPEETGSYFAALRAYDRHDPRRLSAIWRRRFGQGIPR
ncbi:MAG: Fic family protein [Gammaproteobacteria bacterium]|nr:Fic family protein [Gammaproteobacteria bacterium]